MKKVLVFVAMLLCFTNTNAQDYSVVRQTVYGVSIGGAHGSAVVIANGYLLTSAHVVEAVPKAQIYIGPNNATAKIVKIDQAADIALLHAPDIHCPCGSLSERLPMIDEPLVAVGFPLPELTQVQFATDGRFQGLNTAGQLVMTVNISFGNSGGGVFIVNTNELVGLVDSIIAIPQGPRQYGIQAFHHYMSIAVSIVKIRAFLRLATGQPTPEHLGGLVPKVFNN